MAQLTYKRQAEPVRHQWNPKPEDQPQQSSSNPSDALERAKEYAKQRTECTVCGLKQSLAWALGNADDNCLGYKQR